VARRTLINRVAGPRSKAGDRVKTDRRDAVMLARLARSG